MQTELDISVLQAYGSMIAAKQTPWKTATDTSRTGCVVLQAYGEYDCSAKSAQRVQIELDTSVLAAHVRLDVGPKAQVGGSDHAATNTTARRRREIGQPSDNRAPRAGV